MDLTPELTQVLQSVPIAPAPLTPEQNARLIRNLQRMQNGLPPEPNAFTGLPIQAFAKYFPMVRLSPVMSTPGHPVRLQDLNEEQQRGLCVGQQVWAMHGGNL